MSGSVKRSELSNLRMVAGNEKKHPRVILDGIVRNWVGFAWVDEGKASIEDKRNYPIVVD